MSEKEGAKKELIEGLKISGFTLGILSLIFAGSIGMIIAIIGFIFCFYSQRRHPTKLGKVGLILNILGFVLGVAVLILVMTKFYPLIEQLQTGIQ